MEGMLMGRRGDDGIDFAAQGELYRRLDGVAGDSAGTEDPMAVRVRVPAAQTPCAHRDSSLRRGRRDLVLRADHCNLRVDGLGQSASGDLRTDPAGVA